MPPQIERSRLTMTRKTSPDREPTGRASSLFSCIPPPILPRQRLLSEQAGHAAGGVQADAEDRVRHEALEANGTRHEQQRGGDAADSDNQRRPERRVARPVDAPDGE